MGSGWGLCLGPTSWKRPWGLWEMELRLKEQKGPRRAPHPWSQRAGDLTWEPSRLPGLEWAGQMPSAPLPLLPEGPSHLPLLMSLVSGALILSDLHFSSPLSPPRLTSSLGGSSCLLGLQGPPPAAGKCPSWEEMLTLHLPTPPS